MRDLTRNEQPVYRSTVASPQTETIVSRSRLVNDLTTGVRGASTVIMTESVRGKYLLWETFGPTSSRLGD